MRIIILLVSLFAVIQTGCKSAQKYEKVGRMAAADIVDQIMIENKAALVLQGCAEIDSKYDELRGKIKEQILK